MPTVIAVLSFLSMLVGLFAVWHYATLPQQMVRARMAHYIELPMSVTPTAAESRQRQELTGWRATVRRLSRHFEWSGQSQALETMLIRAGLPLRGSEFAAIWAGVVIASVLLMFILGGGTPVMTVTGIVLGFALPLLFLRTKAATRVRQFNDQLGDGLMLVANSLRTGYSFLQAVEMVAKEMPQPMAVEFGRVLKEMNLGVATEDALNNLSRRVVSDDLELVITAVLIQRQVGGNLAEVLDNIAGTIRSRIKLKGEVRTLTAQGRVSGIIIGLLPFALGLMIYWINPEYMQILFDHPAGKFMMGGALVSQFLGMMIVRNIVNIEL
ncbi:MAG: type II secretion system F family protein [Negativicutes bacterium]|nr:type II secretion system F family protein [Negativicutes bacterium]